MPSETPLPREAFLSLAAAAGLDVKSPHIEELYPFLQATLASLHPLMDIDVAGAEPDMAFIPLGASSRPTS
ncbi:MAG: hypothetical protein QF659_02750 [Dehalococcoidia bacterium]|jgi:hypothetical protein|nr:hypothetical protein [Dehalococcoidia bacterium]